MSNSRVWEGNTNEVSNRQAFKYGTAGPPLVQGLQSYSRAGGHGSCHSTPTAHRIGTSMLENWCGTALAECTCLCLSPLGCDSDLLHWQILEPITRPPLVPLQSDVVQTPGRGNQTEFPLIQERRRDSSLPHLQTICFPEHLGRNYSDWEGPLQDSNLESQRAVQAFQIPLKQLIQGSNKAQLFLHLQSSAQRPSSCRQLAASAHCFLTKGLLPVAVRSQVESANVKILPCSLISCNEASMADSLFLFQ